MNSAPSSPDPLTNLRDIHLPPDVGIWPLAPGWWLLSCLLIAALTTGVYIWNRRRKRSRYRRQAQQLLQQLHHPSQTTEAELAQINQLLKRVALKAYPNLGVPSMNGTQWVNFLRRSAPSAPIPDNLDPLLSQRLYDKTPVEQEDIHALSQFARAWINQHLPESQLTVTEAAPC